MNDYPTEEEDMQLNRMMPEEDEVMAAMVQVYEDLRQTRQQSVLDFILRINAESQKYCRDLQADTERKIRQEQNRMMYVNKHFEPQFMQEAQKVFEERRNQKNKSVEILGCGVIGYRKSPEKMEIKNGEAAIAWAQQNCPDAIKTSVRVVVSPLKEHFKKTGELPDGCEYVEAHEKFYAKPIDGKDIQARPQLPEGESDGPADA